MKAKEKNRTLQKVWILCLKKKKKKVVVVLCFIYLFNVCFGNSNGEIEILHTNFLFLNVFY